VGANECCDSFRVAREKIPYSNRTLAVLFVPSVSNKMPDPLLLSAGGARHTFLPSNSESSTIPLIKPGMLGRRTDGQYRPLPQSPDVGQDLDIPSAIEEGELTADEVPDDILDDHTLSDAPVDNRIQWVHFMLGSAFLLPWNGGSQIMSRGMGLIEAHSHDHRRTVFSLAIAPFFN